MTNWTRLIQRGVLCGLMQGGLAGTSMSAGPPVGQIAASDHAALAAWYDKEAVQLRQQANDERAMADAYRKNPSAMHAAGGGMSGSHKIDSAQHCDTLAYLYTKAAEEDDALAQGHRDMLKK